MDIKVTFSEKEVESLLIESVAKRFGPAPEGYEYWASLSTYSSSTVETIKKKSPPDVSELEEGQSEQEGGDSDGTD